MDVDWAPALSLRPRRSFLPTRTNVGHSEGVGESFLVSGHVATERNRVIHFDNGGRRRVGDEKSVRLNKENRSEETKKKKSFRNRWVVKL